MGMAASQAPPPAQLASIQTQVRQLDGATYYSAAAAIFFTMFVVGTGLLSLLEERKRHTLSRLLSTPISPGRILAAKFLLSFTVGVGSVALFMLFSRFLLGANWVDLPVTALLVIAAVAAATGIVSLVAGLARTAEQAQNFQSVVAVTMGILGGTFFPIAGGSAILNALSLVTPHAWFMRGLGDLSGGGGLQEVTIPLLCAERHCSDNTGFQRSQRPAEPASMKTLAIGWVYVLRILREPASLFFFFLFPVLMVFIIGIQFGGQGGRAQLGISGDTTQAITDKITDNLEHNEALRLVFYEDESEMLKAVERGAIAAGTVFPSRMAARVAVGEPVLIGFVSAPTGLGPQLEATVRDAVTEALIPYRAARFAVDILGVEFQQSWDLATRIVDEINLATLSVESVGESLFPPDMGRFDGGAASNLVLFMFLTALTGATAMVADREMGLDTRIVSTPTSVGRLLSGYVTGQFGITFFQGVYIMVLSLAVFGVDWKNLGASLLLMMALSLAGAGAGMLLGSFRLAEPATIGIGVTSGLVLGALGGAMVPLEVLPDTIRTVARFTPQGWAMLGFRDLQWDGSVVDVLDNVAVLLGIGAVLAAAASLSLRRTLTRPS